jgi:signal transduction histidine kinase
LPHTFCNQTGANRSSPRVPPYNARLGATLVLSVTLQSNVAAIHPPEVLVLTPDGKDARTFTRLLSDNQIACRSVEDVAALTLAEINQASALLIAEEALTPASVEALRALLAMQPVWSDLPLLVLVSGGRQTAEDLRREHERLALPQATLQERPVRTETLLATVRFAVRARQRQFQIRGNLEQQRLAEQALRKSEKLAVAGRLAASIAHEINNPLESVTNLLYLIQTANSLEDAQRYCATAETELKRVSEIATQTLRFYRQQTQATVLDVTELAESVLTLYQGRLHANMVRVVRDYGTHTRLLCYAGELRQLISNLVSNALDAMRTGGTLTVRLRDAREPISARHREGPRRQGVSVVIGDTGTGIPHSVRNRIFEPFVTTKGETGTGLGLWVSGEILRKHEGTLRFYTSLRKPRSGTVFRIFLPQREHVEQTAPAEAAAAA